MWTQKYILTFHRNKFQVLYFDIEFKGTKDLGVFEVFVGALEDAGGSGWGFEVLIMIQILLLT